MNSEYRRDKSGSSWHNKTKLDGASTTISIAYYYYVYVATLPYRQLYIYVPSMQFAILIYLVIIL